MYIWLNFLKIDENNEIEQDNSFRFGIIADDQLRNI